LFQEISFTKRDLLMCLAVPTQVVEILENTMCRVRVGNGSTLLTCSTMLLPEPPRVGDYLIVHAGFAMHKLDPEEAEKSLAALRELAAAMEKNGDMAVLEAEQRQD
jgi:hydrogenase expression/formation protein HypC